MTRFDHLVVAARDLFSGCAWARELLGAEFSQGGAHERFGTHNRLLRLGDRAFMEIIAIDPHAGAPVDVRWFGLDELARHDALAAGPRLVAWVAAADDVQAAAAASPIDLGPIEVVRRGTLEWQITVRHDGTLAADGAMPVLIQWPAGSHPTSVMPQSGFTLAALEIEHPDAAELASAFSAIELERDCIRLVPASPRVLRALIRKPDGAIVAVAG